MQNMAKSAIWVALVGFSVSPANSQSISFEYTYRSCNGECSSDERCGPIHSGANCISWTGSDNSMEHGRNVTNICDFPIRIHVDIKNNDDCEFTVPANDTMRFTYPVNGIKNNHIKAFERCNC